MRKFFKIRNINELATVISAGVTIHLSGVAHRNNNPEIENQAIKDLSNDVNIINNKLMEQN